MHAATRRDFEFKLEVFESRLEEEDELVLVMLDETGLLMLFSKWESLILRSSWLKLDLWFEDNSLDEVSDSLISLDEVLGASTLGYYFQVLPIILEDWMALISGLSSSIW